MWTRICYLITFNQPRTTGTANKYGYGVRCQMSFNIEGSSLDIDRIWAQNTASQLRIGTEILLFCPYIWPLTPVFILKSLVYRYTTALGSLPLTHLECYHSMICWHRNTSPVLCNLNVPAGPFLSLYMTLVYNQTLISFHAWSFGKKSTKLVQMKLYFSKYRFPFRIYMQDRLCKTLNNIRTSSIITSIAKVD